MSSANRSASRETIPRIRKIIHRLNWIIQSIYKLFQAHPCWWRNPWGAAYSPEPLLRRHRRHRSTCRADQSRPRPGWSHSRGDYCSRSPRWRGSRERSRVWPGGVPGPACSPRIAGDWSREMPASHLEINQETQISGIVRIVLVLDGLFSAETPYEKDMR